MAESLIPEIVPGLVAVEYVGPERKGGPQKGSVKNVYPIDAKELLMSREYKLVENGAVEAARLNANPLRRIASDPALVVTEVTGIEGQVHVADSEKEAEKAIAAADHKGEATKVVPQAAKAEGTPTGAKAPDDKK
jgi:hypothetical protein